MADLIPLGVLVLVVIVAVSVMWPKEIFEADWPDEPGASEMEWPKRPDPAEAEDIARRVN